MSGKNQRCETCRFWDGWWGKDRGRWIPLVGVCENEESAYRADDMLPNDWCEDWQAKQEEPSDG